MTNANLFVELARLFPPLDGTALLLSRQQRVQPLCIADALRSDPKTFRPRVSTGQENAKVSARGKGAVYDWHRLFLVRCEEEARACEVPVKQVVSGSGSDQDFSAAFTRSDCDQTEESRAAALWQRVTASAAAPMSDVAHEQGGSHNTFSWSRPAFYELYYVAERTPECGAATAAASTCKKPMLSSLTCEHTFSAAPARKKLVAVGDASLLCGEEWELLRVGQLHAIPGLPQPRPIALPSSPHEQDKENVLRDAWKWECGAAVENYDAATRAVLTGSVCSLHDYHHQLCGSAFGSAEGESVEIEAESRTPRTKPETQTTSNVEHQWTLPVTGAAQQRTKAVNRGSTGQAGSAADSLGSRSTPVSHFPFPMFFSDAVTERGSSYHRAGSPWFTATHATTLDDAPTSASQPTPRWWTVVQPSQTHAVSPCRRNTRHWNCVPSADFLRALAHAERRLSEVGTRDNTTSSSTLHDSARHRVAESAMRHVIEERGVAVLLVHPQEWIYFSLLLHTNPSICSAAASAQTVSGSQCRTHHRSPEASELDGNSSKVAHTTQLPHPQRHRSGDEGLSNFYCFLHPPCRLSAEEVAEMAQLAAGQDGSPSSAAVTMPTTWLVHLSSDVKLSKTVSHLWRTSGLHGGAGGDSTGPSSTSSTSEAEPAEDEDLDLIEDEDDARGCNSIFTSALRRTKARHACEAELLARYLRGHNRHHVTSPLSPCSCTPSRSTAECGSSPSPARCAMTVSPFPSSSDLLRNRSWFAKPFVLAEEMKYGTVVRYTHAVLAVPRLYRSGRHS